MEAADLRPVAEGAGSGAADDTGVEQARHPRIREITNRLFIEESAPLSLQQRDSS